MAAVTHRKLPTNRHVGYPDAKASIRRFLTIALALFLAGFSVKLSAYSVLSHEALIDSAWETGIRPLLVKRFPNATADELRQAHGFAYGGAIIQDIGYYPHGTHFFSDLLHYVRSGDFILAMIRDSQDLNEYAFALGSLSHYAADNNGHRIAVNLAVAMLYPKLRKKYSNVVTYEDDPTAHLRAEFGFDVLEVAKERYASDAYRDFIGFGVSKDLMERAFQEIYSLPLRSVFSDFDQPRGWFVPVQRPDAHTQGDEGRLADQEGRDSARSSRNDSAEIPIQPLPLEFRKQLGEEL
jgi:hypothetical protein